MISSTEENRRLIKSFIVETKEKNKTLSIYYGDILEDESDIVVIPVYGNEKNQGSLYTTFKKNKHEADGYKEERSVLQEEKIRTTLSSAEKRSRTTLFVYSSASEGDLISPEELQLTMKMTFATISSYIFEGNHVASIALPVLFRKGISKDDYVLYVHHLILEASECLRKNKIVEGLKIYLWHEQEVEFWLRILNDRLAVSLEEDIGEGQEKEIREDILASLKRPVYKELLPSWLIRKMEKELRDKVSNVIPLVNDGNKVIDLITIDLVEILELSSKKVIMNPYQRIFAIKSNRLIVEWFGDYIYSVKVFKKYAVNHSPSTLDNIHFMLQFAQILSYYEQIKSFKEG